MMMGSFRKVACGCAALFALAASPAWATGGYSCATSDGSKIEILMGIGFGRAHNHLVNLHVIIGDKAYSPFLDGDDMALGQVWMSDDEVFMDLVDSKDRELVMALRTWTVKDGDWAGKGTVSYKGISHPIMCEGG